MSSSLSLHLVNRSSSQGNLERERTISPLEEKTSKVAISYVFTLNETSLSSSSSNLSSSFYNFSGRQEGEIVFNPIFDGDEEIEEETDSAVNEKILSPISVVSEMLDSPSVSPNDHIQTEEDSYSTMITGSVIIKDDDTQEDSTPAFLLHASAIATGLEWEEYLAEEEERISRDSEKSIRESIFGNPDEFITCSFDESKVVEEVIEGFSDEMNSSNDVEKLMASNRCKVPAGLVQDRINAFNMQK